MQAVKKVRADEIDIEKQGEMVPEWSPMAASRATGEVERYAQTVQGQLGTLKMSMDTTQLK